VKPLVRKRDGGWQLVMPAPKQRFGFATGEPEELVLVSGMPRPADCCSFLRTYLNMTSFEGLFSRADPPWESDWSGIGFRPVAR